MARRRPRLRQRDLGVFRTRAIQQQRVAEDLRDLATGLTGESVGGGVTIELGVLAEPHLDELVIDERAVDRGDEPVVDPVLADLDDRPEIVAERAKVATLFSGQQARQSTAVVACGRG